MGPVAAEPGPGPAVGWRDRTWHSGRREKLLAHIGMTFVGFAFGGYNVISQRIGEMPPGLSPKQVLARQTVFILYRQAGTVPLLFFACLAMLGKIELPRSWQDVALFLVEGLLGVYAQQYFFFLGLQRTSANVAAIFQPLSPVVVVLLAVLVRMERLTWRKAVGILLGCGGAAVMIGPRLLRGGKTNGTGMLLLVANVIGGSSYLLIMRPSYQNYSPITITFWQYFVSLIGMAITTASLCLNEQDAFQHPGSDGYITWYGLGYSVVVASAVNYGLVTWANMHIESSLIGLYGLVQPFSTALFSALFLHTAVKLREVLGFLGVVAGVCLVSWGQYRDQRLEKEKEADEPDGRRERDPETEPLLVQTGS